MYWTDENKEKRGRVWSIFLKKTFRQFLGLWVIDGYWFAACNFATKRRQIASSCKRMFFKNGQTRPLFLYFRSFHMTNIQQIWLKKIDGALWTQTGAARWEAQTNPLSYDGTPTTNKCCHHYIDQYFWCFLRFGKHNLLLFWWTNPCLNKYNVKYFENWK